MMSCFLFIFQPLVPRPRNMCPWKRSLLPVDFPVSNPSCLPSINSSLGGDWIWKWRQNIRRTSAILSMQADLHMDVREEWPPEEVFDQHGSCLDRHVAGSRGACGWGCCFPGAAGKLVFTIGWAPAGNSPAGDGTVDPAPCKNQNAVRQFRD